jgi:hypothetical protein
MRLAISLRHNVRTLEYTLPDGTEATATPGEVAEAVENLLMDGTMVMTSLQVKSRVEQERVTAARHKAIIQALVERAVERGLVSPTK